MAIEIGQPLYRQMTGRYSNGEIKEYIVEKIAKKYIYLKDNERYKIQKDTLKYVCENYSQQNFQLYESKQEILDINEKNKLFELIRKSFDWSGNINNFSLEQLREINKIITP